MMPLSKEDLKVMKDSVLLAEKQLIVALADIAQAKRGGIDVTETEQRALALKDQIRKLKAAYLL
jgi:hypothetical protein